MLISSITSDTSSSAVSSDIGMTEKGGMWGNMPGDEMPSILAYRPQTVTNN